ncbi:MAG: tetratricopeptide repeat protein [Deltaproteobacteria bacterium]|nr:tetratricopeptide repeat protein [Deltaproteobacteria bacterium]
MKTTSLFSLALVLAVFLAMDWVGPEARAMTAYWGRHPQKDRLVFHFEKSLPDFSIHRTGPRELTLELPANIWSAEIKPGPVDLRGSRLLERVLATESGAVITLKTNAFGYVYFPLLDDKKIVVDVHRDPSGAKWTPPTPSPPFQDKAGTEPDPPTIKQLEGQPEPSPNEDIPVADPEPVFTEAPMQAASDEMSQEKPEIDPVQDMGPFYRLRAPVSLEGPETAPVFRSGQIDRTGPRPVAASTPPPETQTVQDPVQIETAPAPDASESDVAEPSTAEPEPEADSEEEYPPESPDDKNVTTGSLESLNATAEAFETFWLNTKAAMQNGELALALGNIQRMLDHPRLPASMVEELQFEMADLLFEIHRDDPRSNYRIIMDAYQAAVNSNPKSARVPAALLNMGYLSLQVGNLPEADGYFNFLRQKYPESPYVPATYFYWAEYHYRQGEYQQAADNFQTIVQKFPDSRSARSAAVGLARSLEKLRFFRQALEIVDYIEKRWPRYYVEDPSFLTVAGNVKLVAKQYEAAKLDLWTYYNLEPDGEQADLALARVGDVYVLTDHNKAARTVYELAVERFPSREGGLIARMRLAEEGIYDTPSIQDMFSVFDRPYNLRPWQIYTDIVTEFPDSPLAPVALVKLAMWQLWEKQYRQVFQTVSDFLDRYPSSELKGNALDAAREAFAQLLPLETIAENYQAIVNIWDRWTFLHEGLSPASRLAVATALWRTGQSVQAIALADPFVSGQIPYSAQSEPALDLILNILVSARSWDRILDIEEKTRFWRLSQAGQRQLSYAQALALENLGRVDQAVPLWRKLAADIELSSGQRAFALYFLAQYATSRDDLENVYIFSQQALSIFMEEEGNEEEIKNCLDLLIRTTERTGRHQEALGWALEYANYVPKGSPDWPSFAYRLATLYRTNADTELWQKTLEAVIKEDPDSLYSKMAASDLQAATIKERYSQFE